MSKFGDKTCSREKFLAEIFFGKYAFAKNCRRKPMSFTPSLDFQDFPKAEPIWSCRPWRALLMLFMINYKYKGYG